MRKRYNTPHRSRVVKTRMTEEEYAEFAERLSAYNMSFTCVRKPPEATQAARDYANSTFGKWKGKCEI